MDKKSNFQTYLWTSINVISGILVGGTPVLICSCIQGFNIGLSLLWSFAFTVAGGILGFLFSVPKIISGNQNTAVPAASGVIEQNNNLTQVSDWLTKILIGAGLVELKEIPKFVLHVAQVMGEGIRTKADHSEIHDAATIMSAGIIIYFVCWGFISGYIVMKLVLSGQFVDSESSAH